MRSPELPTQNSQPENEDDKKVTNRREFLKKAAILAGGVVIGKVGMDNKDTISTKVGNVAEAVGEHIKRIQAENIHEGAGIIMSKKHKPFSMERTMPWRPISIPTIPSPEYFLINILVDGKKGSFEVPKEEFDSYKEGEQVSVVYRSQGTGMFVTVKSIKKSKETPSSN